MVGLLDPAPQPAHGRGVQLGQLLVDAPHARLDLGDAAQRPLQLGRGPAAGHRLGAGVPVLQQALQGGQVALLVGVVGRHHQVGAPLPLLGVAGQVGMDEAGQLAEQPLGVVADHRPPLRLPVRLALPPGPVLPAGQALAGVAVGRAVVVLVGLARVVAVVQGGLVEPLGQLVEPGVAGAQRLAVAGLEGVQLAAEGGQPALALQELARQHQELGLAADELLRSGAGMPLDRREGVLHKGRTLPERPRHPPAVRTSRA